MKVSKGDKTSIKIKKNICGSCTLCCKLLEIKEIDKPLNVWCKDCSVGKGCSIYNERPLSCRKFECLYITHNLKEGLRPDVCHVVFEKVLNSQVYLALVDPDYPDALENDLVKILIVQLLQDKFSVVVTSEARKEKHMILAEGATREGVWSTLQNTYKLMNP